MSISAHTNWLEANQQYLSSALAVVQDILKRHASLLDGNVDETKSDPVECSPVHQSLKQASERMPAPSALDSLCAEFGLSTFERNILLLCAGVELDSAFANQCAAAQGNPQRTYPTYSLALAAFPETHWSALTPDAPLRRWRLIEIGAGQMLTTSPLRIDEWALHYLTGVPCMDERLAGIVRPVDAAVDLVPSHEAHAEKIALAVSSAVSPVIQLCGGETDMKHAIAAAACESAGLILCRISAHMLPVIPAELDTLIHLWEREIVMSAYALMLDCDEMDMHDAARANALSYLIERTNGVIIISCRERQRIMKRPVLTFDVRKPAANEQYAVWQKALGNSVNGLNGQIETLTSQFNMGIREIYSVCNEALVTVEDASKDIGTALWDACRAQTRPHMDNLAQWIEPVATWEDIVLPAHQKQILKEIAVHVRQRAKVYGEWGFAHKSSRGLGISALFVGESGTGKTMAAEVLANELRLDLYRIDLSQVVSKYIGETEKNLRRVFDAAEEGGAILLFDEADALFGKRSEVKDSHDRYANIEVSYLLQRMEAYRGLAILTTNMKNALDTAFLRRIRFVVQFPFPDSAQRAEIWKRIFPHSTPTDGLDMTKLSRLNVAGGNIRNIALNAAFLAADAGKPVSMMHLLQSARTEYAKLERPLTDTETGGWV